MTCEDSLPPKSLAILMQSDFKMLTLQEQLHVVTAALHAQYRPYHVLFKRELPDRRQIPVKHHRAHALGHRPLHKRQRIVFQNLRFALSEGAHQAYHRI